MINSLTIDSLKYLSITATNLWEELETAQSPEAEEIILKKIWETQTDQEIAADTQAELADQLDAEIAGIKARKEYLMQLHNIALVRLERWRSALDKNILQLHQLGTIPTSLIGQTRQINIKQNPPSCEILVNPKELPKEFRTRTVIYTPDKNKIKAAWKEGTPVEGTHIERKLRVEYKLIARNLTETFANLQERANQNGNNGSKSKENAKNKQAVS